MNTEIYLSILLIILILVTTYLGRKLLNEQESHLETLQKLAEIEKIINNDDLTDKGKVTEIKWEFENISF